MSAAVGGRGDITFRRPRSSVASPTSYEDKAGRLWAILSRYGIWRWKPGPPEFFTLPSARRGAQRDAFDVPYGPPISLERAQAVIDAVVAEARRRNWKMNMAVSDSGGNLVAFQRMDGAMLASIQIALHKARASAIFRRPTRFFEDGVQQHRLNYLLGFDEVIASRGDIPLIEQGAIIGAVGCSGGTDSQDESISNAGAVVINR